MDNPGQFALIATQDRAAVLSIFSYDPSPKSHPLVIKLCQERCVGFSSYTKSILDELKPIHYVTIILIEDLTCHSP